MAGSKDKIAQQKSIKLERKNLGLLSSSTRCFYLTFVYAVTSFQKSRSGSASVSPRLYFLCPTYLLLPWIFFSFFFTLIQFYHHLHLNYWNVYRDTNSSILAFLRSCWNQHIIIMLYD